MRLAAGAPLPVAFAAFGVLWGGWQAALPDLVRHYGLSPGPIGAILTVGFAVALPAMAAAGRLVDRLGVAPAIGLPAAAIVVALAALATLSPMPVLVLAVILLAAGSGAYDVAINAAAMGDPGWSRPARLTLLHAAFSGGGVLGALATGAATGAGAPFWLVYAVAAACLAVAAGVAARRRWPPPPAVAAVPRRLALTLLPLAVLAALAFLIEGSMETWSAVYLRDVLGAGAFVGALGPAAFHAAMLLGRLVGAGVATRVGAATTLFVAASMTLSGMALALGVSLPAAAIVGMALAALGASFVAPVVVSAAARRAGGHAGRAASYVLTLGYAGFLVGPSLVGIGAELAGLRAALLVVPAAAAAIAIASRTVAGGDDEPPRRGGGVRAGNRCG